MADIVGPPSVQHSADSWSTTEVKSLQHNHVWTIRGFSQCECRYLETTVKVKEQIIPTQSVGLGDHGMLPFRIRLHPQGNKESNKDFTFFQVFCNAQQARYKAKFAVFNTRNEEIPTTVYTGTQQLHGYFEYIRRDLLIQHIAPQDELQLVLTLTINFDTVTKSSQNPLPRLSAQAEPKPGEVARDLENVFRDRRFCDFMIYVGDRRIDVHKVILAARSPYFAALLEPHTEESKKNCLRLNESDVEFEVMQELLMYMYTGRCTRLSDISLELLAAADRFAMPGLKDIAEQSLRAQLSIESVCRILCVADLHAAILLKKNAIQFITTQSQPVTETDGWKELVSNNPELITEVVQAISAMNSTMAQTYGNANSSSSIISCEPPAAKRTRFVGMDASGHLIRPSKMFASGVRQLKCNKLRPISARFVSNASTAKKERKPAETSSFSMNIFRGKAQLDNVFPYPLNLSSDQRETLNMIVDPTEKFLTEVNDLLKNDETATQPPEVLRQFGELGAFGALVPVEYEGAGLNNSQMARLAELVGAHDLGLGVTMGAHQSIGYKGILLYGDEAMKKKYLPDLATGRKFASFCLTEPGSGSDANSISSTITKSDDGKHYILNGNKIFISNGGFAEVFTVFAQQPIKQADGSTKNKVTAVVVERAFGGVTNGPPEKKMGIKGSNTVTMNFDNVKIPIENRLGGEGEGFKVAMNILNNGRFGIPASMTGTMKYVIQKTVDHITNRVQFGRKLEEYGNVKEKLSQMIVRHYASESIVYMLAATMDAGVQDYQLEAACGKVFTSEAAWWCTDEAIQLHGGYGFIRETGLEVFLRDLRIFRIFEGANDVLRLFVALTGIQHAGLHLQQTAKEIKSGGIGTLFGELTKRVTGGSTGGDFSKVVDSAFTSEAATLDAAIKDFGATIEKLLLKYKKGIIERQFELTRIGDAAIDIFALTCVLSRATFSAKHGASSFEHEKDIVKLFAEQAAARITANLKVAREGSPTEVSLIEKIATDVCKNGGLPQRHPIEL